MDLDTVGYENRPTSRIHYFDYPNASFSNPTLMLGSIIVSVIRYRGIEDYHINPFHDNTEIVGFEILIAVQPPP